MRLHVRGENPSGHDEPSFADPYGANAGTGKIGPFGL